MEFYIKYSDNNSLRLPVAPPSFKILRQNATQTVSVSQLGEVNLWGPELLKAVTIESFWPFHYMPTYCKYSNFIKPKDFEKWIITAKNSKKPVRLVITDSRTGLDINMECLIEQFDTEHKHFNGDMYFSLSFREYRKINVVEQDVSKPPAVTPPTVKPPTNVGGASETTNGYKWHTVVKGDTLWDLAKKNYGNGSKWPTIHKANKSLISNPNRLKPGWKIKIPDKA